MIEGLKPYAEYKESGLPWLAAMPSHWRTSRNGNLFQQRNDTGYPDLPVLEVSLRTGVRVRSFGASERKQVMADARKYKRAAAGDVAYNMMRMWQGAVGVAPIDGLVSPAYVVARPLAGTKARYYTTLFRNASYMGEIDAASRGIVKDRNRLYWDQFKQMRSLVPPPDEQAAIVRFLDHANRTIDGFIRAKRKLIALLGEQKQAIIHRAITRGLNPDVPLKRSGLPWLGDIPRHWTLKRFKFLASINSGQVDPREPHYRKMALIAPNHIQSVTGRLLATETALEQGADSGKYLVREGQVIYSKIRPNLRKATIAPCECLCSADMYAITPRGELFPDFLLLLLLSQPFTKFAVDASMRVAMPKVNREALANCLMWYPNHGEQEALLVHVAEESKPYDSAIARTEREIALMQEYRMRLTADVVTGKLDVRAAATTLPALPTDATADPETDDPLEETEAQEIP
jgi:type I restriction enzyme S subunit